MSDTAAVPTWQLHHRLALALEFSGVSEEEMAQELGVHINTIRNYRAGRRAPKRGDVKNWADKCNVDFNWLWGGMPYTDTVHLREGDQLALWGEDDLLSGGFRWHPALVAA